MPRLRAAPEDFRVDEIPLYAPAGEGSHTFVRVEKRLRTTEEVARDLARAAGVRPGDVGYAGRKDRVAVCTQWFSVPDLDPEQALGLALPGARVLEAARHPHKLRTGQLRANRFELVVRDVDEALGTLAAERLARMGLEGMPNRFGSQRFGADDANVARARRLLRGEAPLRDRRAARFLLSSLQAAVFNDVLAARPLPLGQIELGDVAVRHDSGGLFLVDDPEREAPRATRFEISATGPIFGTRVIEPGGRVAEREGEALASQGVSLDRVRTLRGVRVRGARRALRVRPEQPRIEPVRGALRLGFALPAGSYATVLAEELLAPPP